MCSFFKVGIAHYMDSLEISIKKQIQNELIRSRNSMIKEIRRELFEKMTHAMRSQGVYVILLLLPLEIFSFYSLNLFLDLILP